MVRVAVPDTLPLPLVDLLQSCPRTGSGTRAVHRWLLECANHLRHYVSPEEAATLLEAHISRRPKHGEIAETILEAYGIAPSAKEEAAPRHVVDLTLIGQIVAERAEQGLEALRRSSPAPVPDSTDAIIKTLFPPYSFLCVGRAIDEASTWPLAKIKNLERFQFICPNPMRDCYWYDETGKRHARCNANVLERRFIICDLDIKASRSEDSPASIYDPLIFEWEKNGITALDAQAAILGYLAERGPLVLVTCSGNKSLQGWFYCSGENESADSPLRHFFSWAVILGADRAGWVRCQLFRMPGALRSDTRLKQETIFFNPQILCT